jgi:hypothetical protein
MLFEHGFGRGTHDYRFAAGEPSGGAQGDGFLPSIVTEPCCYLLIPVYVSNDAVRRPGAGVCPGCWQQLENPSDPPRKKASQHLDSLPEGSIA